MPNRVPATDLDSRVMPNKDGGHAPNYTPTATVDLDSGLIVAADVLNAINEDAEMIAACEEVQEQFALPSPPAMATGANIAACEERGIPFYSPVRLPDPAANPALRDDPTQPVAQADWDRLPTHPLKLRGQACRQLDKTAFIYDEARDCYWCPLGQPLHYASTTSEARGRGRRVRRHAGERSFATIQHQFGLRRFLLRGLKAVTDERRWAVAAFNLHRMIGLLKCRAGPSPSPASL